MANLANLKLSENKKILIYGDSGVGKTCFIASCPSSLFVFDFDGKISSAAAFLNETNPDKLKEIQYEVYTPQASQGGLDIFNRFEEKLKALEELSKKGAFPFKTVAIDSLTTFTSAMMQLIMRENPGVKRYAVGVPALQDYSILLHRFIPLMSRILALPCNVVATAHIKRDKNEATGELISRPMLPGQLPEQLPIVFEEVYRAFTETKDGKIVHAAQTRGDSQYKCRTQLRGAPQFIPLSWNAVQKYLTQPIVKETENATVKA